jgi:hypothetical protein
MISQPGHPTTCSNLNHRRAHAPVRHCPGCGGVVNDRVSPQRCSEAQHAAARRERSMFCVDCGTRLIAAR